MLPSGNDFTGRYRGVRLTDAWFLGDRLVYQGPRLYLLTGQPAQSEWNVALFVQKTGDVYAKRICTNYHLPWRYIPCEYPFLTTYPESNPKLPGVLEVYLEYLMENMNERQPPGTEGPTDGRHRHGENLQPEVST